MAFRGIRHGLNRLRRGGSTSTPSKGVVFEILQQKRRRYAFHYLRQQEGTVTLGELSDVVAAWENDTSVESVEPESRQRVYISLLQNHLPKMDAEDIVDFDPDEGTVELSKNASALEIYLETVPEDDILWAHYYLGLTAMSAGVLILIWQGVLPFADHLLVVWGLITAGFVISTALHHRYLRNRRLGRAGSPPSEL